MPATSANQQPLDTPWAVSDLCDAYCREPGWGVQIFQNGLQSFGGKRAYFGEVVTIGSNTESALSLTSSLEKPGHGKVLLVDGKGDTAQALVGDRIAGLAVENGWAGIIVNGYVRDADELPAYPVGIHAWGTRPNKAAKLGELVTGQSFSMAGVEVKAGLWVYADGDGIILMNRRHAA